MSLSTFSFTDEARSGIPLSFLHPEYRNREGRFVPYEQIPEEDWGMRDDVLVHPFQWDANVYPCPECLQSDTRVTKAVALAHQAASALRQPSDDWESVRYTSWLYYEALAALYETVEAQASVYDRKDTMLNLIGKRAAESLYNVALSLTFRATRQHQVSVAVTVTRWEEAAGVFDALLASPMGKNTSLFELSPDFLRLLASSCLATAHETAFCFYIRDTQHYHADVLQLAHRTQYFFSLAEAVCANSGSIPAQRAWQNLLAVKSEYYRAMTLYVASLEPGTTVGDSRRRRAAESFQAALDELQTDRATLREAAAVEISTMVLKCTRFRALVKRGKLPEAVKSAAPFRNDVRDLFPSGAFCLPKRRDIHVVMPSRAALASPGGFHGRLDADVEAKAVAAGRYGLDRSGSASAANAIGGIQLGVTLVQADLRGQQTVPVAFDPVALETWSSTTNDGRNDQEAPAMEETQLPTASGSDTVSDRGAANTTPPHDPPPPEQDTTRPPESSVPRRATDRDVAAAPAVVDIDADTGRIGAQLPPGVDLAHVVEAVLTVDASHATVARLPATVVFLVDLNHEDKAFMDRLRSCVVSTIQTAGFTEHDRVGVVVYDSVDAAATTIVVPATNAELKKVYQRIVKAKGRGKFEDSCGTPIVSGVASALDALENLDSENEGKKPLAGSNLVHIVVVSNGDDRTFHSDSADWTLWAAGGGALRNRLVSRNVHVHTLAVTYAADDALLSSLASVSGGQFGRVTSAAVEDDDAFLDMQKCLASFMAASLDVVAADPVLCIRSVGSGVRILAAEWESPRPPAVRQVKVDNNLSGDGRSAGSAKRPLRVRMPLVTATADPYAVTLPLRAMERGQASHVLVTFAVAAATAAHQDLIQLGSATLSYTASSIASSSGSAAAVENTAITRHLVHINNTRIEDRDLHGHLPQAQVHEVFGTNYLVTSSEEKWKIRGREAVSVGNGVHTTKSGTLSIVAPSGLRIDLSPQTEIRVDEISRQRLAVHLVSGSLHVNTNADTVATVTCTGYRCAVDGNTRCKIQYSAQSLELQVKTITGRCSLSRELSPDEAASAMEAAGPPSDEMRRPSALVAHAAAVVSVDVLMSRQTKCDPGDGASIPAPWLMSLSEEERHTMTMSPSTTSPASRMDGGGALAQDTSLATNHQLRALVELDTVRCRLELVHLLTEMHRKLAWKLCRHTRSQTNLVVRSRQFYLSQLVASTRIRLANSIAYITANEALDEWRLAVEALTPAITMPDTTTLTWRVVQDVSNVAASLGRERHDAVQAAPLFLTDFLVHQLRAIDQDKNARLEASKQLRLEEQMMNRQTEEHRRELALLRLFQSFRWEGFGTIWIKDLLDALHSLPSSAFTDAVVRRCVSILEAIGTNKALTDEQFATTLVVALHELSPAEFTIIVETLYRRCAAARNAIDASPITRAVFSAVRALDGAGAGVVSVSLVARLMTSALQGTALAPTKKEATELVQQRFLSELQAAYDAVKYEVVHTALRRKSTAALLQRPKSASTLLLPVADTEIVNTDSSETGPVSVLYIRPTRRTSGAGTQGNGESDEGTAQQKPAVETVDAAGATPEDPPQQHEEEGERLVPNICVLLPVLTQIFDGLDLPSAVPIVTALYDAFDASQNHLRTFDVMMAREAKLEELRHLTQWEMRHVFDGAALEKEVARFCHPSFSLPERVISTTLDQLVKPLCVLAGFVALPSSVVSAPPPFDADNHGAAAATAAAGSGGGLFGPVNSNQNAAPFSSALLHRSGMDAVDASPSTWSALRDRVSFDFHGLIRYLVHFSPLCVSPVVARQALDSIDHDDLDPELLSTYSPLLAAFARWTRLMLRLTLLQNEYEKVEHAVPQSLLTYTQHKKLHFPVESASSKSIAVVAASLRQREGSPVSPQRNASPARLGGSSREPTALTVLTPSRPSTASGRPSGATTLTSPIASAAPAVAQHTSRFAVDGPRPPTFAQRLQLRPSTAGTLRSGFVQEGPLPAAYHPPINSKVNPWVRSPSPIASAPSPTYVPSSFSRDADAAIRSNRGVTSATVSRPQSAYVRSASKAYHFGPSMNVLSSVSSHRFYGDHTVPLSAGTPTFRTIPQRPSSASVTANRTAASTTSVSVASNDAQQQQ